MVASSLSTNETKNSLSKHQKHPINGIGEGNGTLLQYLAWKIPWTEEHRRLQSMGSLRVWHDWVTSLSLFTFMHWTRKWQPTPVFLPGESQGRQNLVTAIYGVAQSRTWLKQLSSSSSLYLNIPTTLYPADKNFRIWIVPRQISSSTLALQSGIYSYLSQKHVNTFPNIHAQSCNAILLVSLST